MGILSWVIFGAFAGWIASIVMGRNNQQGCIMNLIVGVIGASLGGWLMSFLGKTGVTGFNLNSFIVAVFGAVVLLAITNLLFSRK